MQPGKAGEEEGTIRSPRGCHPGKDYIHQQRRKEYRQLGDNYSQHQKYRCNPAGDIITPQRCQIAHEGHPDKSAGNHGRRHDRSDLMIVHERCDNRYG